MSSQDNIPTAKRTPSTWEISPFVQDAVNKFITNDPVGYRAAQNFGDFLVNHPQFSNLDTFKVEQRDVAGEELLYQEICKMMQYHGIKPKELELSELTILRNKLGADWKDEVMKTYGFELDDFS